MIFLQNLIELLLSYLQLKMLHFYLLAAYRGSLRILFIRLVYYNMVTLSVLLGRTEIIHSLFKIDRLNVVILLAVVDRKRFQVAVSEPSVVDVVVKRQQFDAAGVFSIFDSISLASGRLNICATVKVFCQLF